MKFSTRQMQNAATYISKKLVYPHYPDKKTLNTAKENVALRIFAKLNYIRKNFIQAQEIIINNDKQNIHFRALFEDLKQNEGIVYPSNEPKLQFVLKHKAIGTRVEKRKALINHNYSENKDSFSSKPKDFSEEPQSDKEFYKHFNDISSGSESSSNDEESDEGFNYIRNWKADAEGYLGDEDITDDSSFSFDDEQELYIRGNNIVKELSLLSCQDQYELSCSNFDDALDVSKISKNPAPAMQVNLLNGALIPTFEELHKISKYVYLSGGAVVDLVLGEHNSSDLDFVLSHSEHASLKKLGYSKDTFNQSKNSYYRKEPNAVDIRIASYIETYPDSWMLANTHTRDFTVCMLYCDFIQKNANTENSFFHIIGNIYDPTGQALLDIREKRLRMHGGNEIEKLKKDPCRIIRAFKYMERGYYPDAALDFALRNFNNLDPIHTNHLYAVTRKLLSKSSRLEKRNHINRLDQYGLLDTLFDLEPIGPYERANQNVLNLALEQKVQKLEIVLNLKLALSQSQSILGFSNGFSQITLSHIISNNIPFNLEINNEEQQEQNLKEPSQKLGVSK